MGETFPICSNGRRNSCCTTTFGEKDIQIKRGETFCKPFVHQNQNDSLKCSNDVAGVPPIDSPIDEEALSVMFGESGHTASVSNHEHTYVRSREVELEGLHKRGTFKVVKRNKVPDGTRISRWVDTLKAQDGQITEKSRLVAQNYRDKGATEISTKAPTISRMGQRTALALSAISRSIRRTWETFPRLMFNLKHL